MNPTPQNVAMALGAVSLSLILGALAFQYIGHIPPCEMCHWQRWPHIAAAVVGLRGGLYLRHGALPARFDKPIAWLTILLVATAGGIGVFHAGVEWQWWQGPTACTGNAFHGVMDLSAPIVRCDIAAWRLFGLSLAGYNALISLSLAGLGTWLLAKTKKS
ncbi:MAG: disulfide bond formation protein B [Proteobacteria bacterium]|nr:disulfide bond formation protein B [Pseudomonadota bacterium]